LIPDPDQSFSKLVAYKFVLLPSRTYKGHLIGHIIIEPIASDEEADDTAAVFKGRVRIPFKNENLICEHTSPEGVTKVCSFHSLRHVVPFEDLTDLISI
jgi:hypothetical protein